MSGGDGGCTGAGGGHMMGAPSHLLQHHHQQEHHHHHHNHHHHAENLGNNNNSSNAMMMHVCDEDGSMGGAGEPVRKRKSFDFNLVSEKMKRCRIAGIPGEIRLRKDVAECADLGDVSFLDHVRVLQTADPLTVQVQFEARQQQPPPPPSAGVPSHDHPRPSFFSVKVPKFYPHEPPVVTVPDVAFHGRSPFVAVDGKVTHPLLRGGWRAVGCLKDVIKTLASIRECESEQHLLLLMTATADGGGGNMHHHHHQQPHETAAGGESCMSIC